LPPKRQALAADCQKNMFFDLDLKKSWKSAKEKLACGLLKRVEVRFWHQATDELTPLFLEPCP
jgi:hypothetical protein